jgi:transposase
MLAYTEVYPSFLLADEVWQRVKPVIPPEAPKPKGGRPRMDDRKARDAIFYVMRTGCHLKLGK